MKNMGVDRKPSLYERVDQAKPGTGVGRWVEGSLYSPLPALGGHLPPGKGREKIFFKKGLILERFSVIILDCMKYRREEV